jgi:site-specific DNA-methyltransferase (adenine-specific)
MNAPVEINQIIIGKCELELFKLPAGCAQMVITSPPYNVGIDYGNGHNDNLPESKYYEWVEKWLVGCYHVLCDGGRIAINIPYIGNVDISKGYGLQTYVDKYIPLLKKVGFTPRELLTWIKSHDDEMTSFCGDNTAWGSYLSPNNPYCRSFSEMIIVCHKGRPDRGKTGQNDITKEEFLLFTRNVWVIAAENDRHHPAPFPEELPYRLIRLYTWPGDLVIDPFSGRGTTVGVAARLGRKWIGIEQNPEFVGMFKFIETKETQHFG